MTYELLSVPTKNKHEFRGKKAVVLSLFICSA
jgi:hypothetical protein